MTAPLVYVVTLAWNRRDDTLACLDSLAHSTREFRAIVVDNGSTDGTPDVVCAAFPQVRVMVVGRNLGFAGGMNIGLRCALEAGAEHVLIVNNDTLIDPLLLDRLLAHAAPDVGALSPLIYYASQPDVIWAAGSARSRWTLEQVGDLRGRRDNGQWPPVVERDFVPGCAMLFSSEALERVGLFDERFFFYYEDNDWCLRARRAGFRLLLVPQARLWHKVAASSGGSDSPGERYLMALGSVLFFRKHVHGLRWLIVGPYRLGSAVKTTFRLLFHNKFAAVGAYWRGLRDGVMDKR